MNYEVPFAVVLPEIPSGNDMSAHSNKDQIANATLTGSTGNRNSTGSGSRSSGETVNSTVTSASGTEDRGNDTAVSLGNSGAVVKVGASSTTVSSTLSQTPSLPPPSPSPPPSKGVNVSKLSTESDEANNNLVVPMTGSTKRVAVPMTSSSIVKNVSVNLPAKGGSVMSLASSSSTTKFSTVVSSSTTKAGIGKTRTTIFPSTKFHSSTSKQQDVYGIGSEQVTESSEFNENVQVDNQGDNADRDSDSGALDSDNKTGIWCPTILHLSGVVIKVIIATNIY